MTDLASEPTAPTSTVQGEIVVSEGDGLAPEAQTPTMQHALLQGLLETGDEAAEPEDEDG